METLFSDYFQKYSNNILFTSYDGIDIKYSKVLDHSENLQKLKLNKKIIISLIDNEVSGLLAYLSIINVGGIPQMVSHNIDNDGLKNLIKKYKPNFLLIDSERLKKFSSEKIIYKIGNYSLLELEKDHYNINTNLGLLLTTSGSTGTPKYVRLSKNNILSNGISISKYLNLKENDLPITILPPSYTYGLSIIHSHIIVGATIAVCNFTLFDNKFWSFLIDKKITSISGVPFHYEILNKLKFRQKTFTNLKTLTQAGGKLNDKLALEFAKYSLENNINFFIMYGQTEATARMTFLDPKKAIFKLGSIGKPIPGGELVLKSLNGSTIKNPYETGELIYKGENVFLGYARSYEDLGKGDENFGVLKTGDLAERDKDGDYFIKGRLNRFLKMFGNRVNLFDVEKFLYKNNFDVVCSGVDDLLFIYTKDNDEKNAKIMRKLVCEFIKITPKAVAIIKIHDFPRKESGKISYSELKSIPSIRIL